MKRLFTFLVLTFLSVSLFSQADISSALRAKMKNAKSYQTERVCIFLWDEIDLMYYKAQFDAQKLTTGERARALQRVLSQHAAKTQQNLITHISHKTSNEISQFWIVNMIMLDLPLSMVNDLAQRSDISYMMLDTEFEQYLIKPTKMEASTSKSVGGTELGLLAINAHKLWAMGYTGRGRICYTMDTGIWPENPALGGRFLGNYYTMDRAWFGFDSEIPIDKGNSHGTHVTGTVLGLEEATNDTIGVAFNAYFMVSDPIVTNIADIKPYSDFALAFQWAFNPDGDTTTIDDVPDVINNSWGRGPTKDTNLCHSPVSQMLTAIEVAGIANVFSAGNEGPNDTTISEPHHISTSLVNTFTVGAVNPHDTTFPIASFSSRGPTVCPVTGSLLIKPEVSAPGQNIRSCVDKEGYASYSGTSMAAPHTSGAVLLLKEAFPYLSGEEILLALYYTAVDLGDPGEDNTYGMGMIDVYAAFQYLATSNTPVPPVQSTYDIAIKDIKLPFKELSCDTIIDIKIIAENKGDSTIQNFMLYYWSDPAQVDSMVWNTSIAAGQMDSITIQNIQLSAQGKSEYFARIQPLANLIENDLINNRKVKRFDIRPLANFPFVEDFEHGSLTDNNWYIANPDLERTWVADSCGGLQFGTTSALMSCHNYLPKKDQSDILLSPKINIPASGDIWLSFKYAYTMRYNLFPDTLKVGIVSNCDLDSRTIIWEKGGDSLSTFDTTAIYFVPSSSHQWKEIKISLNAYQGTNNLMLAFESINRAGNNIWIDDVKVYAGDNIPVFIPELPKRNIHVYPNPTNELLNIESNLFFNSDDVLQIVDMNGRIISEQRFGDQTQHMQLNVSNLPKGVYIVRHLNANERNHFIFTKN
jgi:bacillopeptidase F